MADLNPIVDKAKLIMAETKTKIADNDGWDRGDFKDIYEALVKTVSVVDDVAEEFGGLTDTQKREAISKTINWMVDIPVLPNFLEDKVFDFVVGLVWNAARDRLGK